jgi:hypothetical protein
LSLYGLVRDRLRTFLLQKKVENFILGMVIILCLVIFLELSIEQQIAQNKWLDELFYVVNFFLLQFFIIEILLKTFALFLEFLQEPINIFDATIVIISYYMIIVDLKAKILGILRVLRLIKVIIQMKKVADKKKAD